MARPVKKISYSLFRNRLILLLILGLLLLQFTAVPAFAHTVHEALNTSSHPEHYHPFNEDQFEPLVASGHQGVYISEGDAPCSSHSSKTHHSHPCHHFHCGTYLVSESVPTIGLGNGIIARLPHLNDTIANGFHDLLLRPPQSI